MTYINLDADSNSDLDTSIYPSMIEIRRWAQARRPDMIMGRGRLSKSVIAAWDRENPDRPFVKAHSAHGTARGYENDGCRCARCTEAHRDRRREVIRGRAEQVAS